ncbi:MAG: putative GNAT superfamily acetyltransferase [Polaribacter sp.]|jgi:predicted GNAT superfamily acetyltransferase
MFTYTKVTADKELSEILDLQRKNLFQNLSKDDREEHGFVTIKHTLEILKAMQQACPHTIAKYEGKVVGFALSMTKDFANDIAVLKPMFDEISKLVSTEKYLVMGQICIAKDFRKQGVFRGLYQFMKTVICLNIFDAILTEIDLKNHSSLKAHESVGFLQLKDFKNENRSWRIVALKV